jgi:hypothetical protein
MAIRYSAPHLVPKALYFAVDDLDEVHQRATTLGCLSDESVHGTPGGKPLVRPWGERSFYCNAPWGNPLLPPGRYDLSWLRSEPQPGGGTSSSHTCFALWHPGQPDPVAGP